MLDLFIYNNLLKVLHNGGPFLLKSSEFSEKNEHNMYGGGAWPKQRQNSVVLR